MGSSSSGSSRKSSSSSGRSSSGCRVLKIEKTMNEQGQRNFSIIYLSFKLLFLCYGILVFDFRSLYPNPHLMLVKYVIFDLLNVYMYVPN